MHKFYSRSSLPDTVASPVGNGERSLFEVRVVDGKKQLVVTGKEDFKGFIEASKEDTLISNIMKRFEQGDVNALSKVQGFYGDVTAMPDNLAEAQSILIKLESQFNALPSDVRAKFDNSFNKYVQDVSNFTVEEYLGHFNLNEKLNSDNDKDILIDDKESAVE